jgi:hypothetical protein
MKLLQVTRAVASKRTRHASLSALFIISVKKAPSLDDYLSF